MSPLLLLFALNDTILLSKECNFLYSNVSKNLRTIYVEGYHKISPGDSCAVKNKLRGLKVAKEDQRLIGLMDERLNGR